MSYVYIYNKHVYVYMCVRVFFSSCSSFIYPFIHLFIYVSVRVCV